MISLLSTYNVPLNNPNSPSLALSKSAAALASESTCSSNSPPIPDISSTPLIELIVIPKLAAVFVSDNTSINSVMPSEPSAAELNTFEIPVATASLALSECIVCNPEGPAIESVSAVVATVTALVTAHIVANNFVLNMLIPPYIHGF